VKNIKYQSYVMLKEQLEEKYPEQPLLFEFDNEVIFRRTKLLIRKCS
jgi:hypothetical protein